MRRHAGELAPEVGAIPLMTTVYQLARQRFTKMVAGTMYRTPSHAELGIEFLLTQ